MQGNVQEAFFSWLSSRVSSQQLSEFFIICQDIESFCMSNHCLTKPLFETTNPAELNDVVDTIRSNRSFQLKYYRQLGKIRKVMEYYLVFLRTNLKEESELTAESSAVKPPKENASIANTSDSVVSSKADNRENNKETDVWSFADKDIDFSNKVPISIIYFGEEIAISRWSDFFVEIINAMAEDYPAVVKGIAGYRLSKIGKVVISYNAKRISKPETLNNGLYLETDCTPSQIIYVARLLMDKCNMDYDNIELKYVIREPSVQEENISLKDEPSEPKKVTVLHDEQRIAFENWMIEQDKVLIQTAQLFSSTLNLAGKYVVQHGISDTELYDIHDPVEVQRIILQLLEHEEFFALPDGQWHRYRVAIAKYLQYCKALPAESVSTESPNPVPKEKPEELIEKRYIEFIAWARSRQIQDSEIKEHLLAMYDCSDFAREHKYMEKTHIVLIDSISELENITKHLQSDSEFMQFDAEHQNHLLPAMNILIGFFGRNIVPEVSAPINTDNEIPDSDTDISQPCEQTSAEETNVSDTHRQYAEILKENFPEGFRPAKIIDRNRFKVYYSERFGEEVAVDDEQLIHALMEIGTFRDERIFVKDETEQEDLLEEIKKTIAQTFNTGASCIYLECLFRKFQDQLAEKLRIYHVNSLENVLFSDNNGAYVKRYHYIHPYNIDPSPYTDVIEYMKKSHVPVTYSKIEEDLWYIPLEKIKQTFVTTPSIVNISPEAYFYAPNLPVSETEMKQIAELINRALLQRSYISDEDLMMLIVKDCPSVIMNTPDYPTKGIRNAFAYLLRDKFAFTGAIISHLNEEISMSEVFSDYCRRSEKVTVDELKDLAVELNTVVYWDSVYSEMVRMNQDEFICRNRIDFDVEKTDAVLDRLITGDYAPLKSIDLFLHFPVIDIPWNSYVLESYIVNYSEKFKLIHSSFAAGDCCGAVVRRESHISDYRTLIIETLAEHDGWKTKSDALQILVDLGYQQKKSYSDIVDVMQEAKIRRSEM